MGTIIFLFDIDIVENFLLLYKGLIKMFRLHVGLRIEKLRWVLFSLYIFALSFTISLEKFFPAILNKYDFKNTQATFDYVKD